jgi:cytosine deaminase
MSALLIRDIRPLGAAPADVLCEAGRIAALGPSLAPPPGAMVEEGGGALLLPGLIEGHCHLDKTLWGRPWYANTNPPTREARIANEKRARGALGMDAAREGRALAEAHLAAGTTRLRSHVDIDETTGLRNVEALLGLREAMAGRIEIQLVAFPQSGILRTSGCESSLDAALRLGCDAVGGMDPSIVDRDPVRHLDIVFALAERHGKPVDIHLHEPHELGAFALELITERSRALGMRGRVTVSHGFCLGEVPAPRSDALLALLAEAGVALCTSAPAYSAVPPLARARELGVTVFAGNDNIRDTWSPYGQPDMLDRAMQVGSRNAFRRDADLALAFETVTAAAAKGCGFEGHGLAVGDRADLVLVAAKTLAEAIVARPPRALVVSRGAIVSRAGGR